MGRMRIHQRIRGTIFSNKPSCSGWSIEKTRSDISWHVSQMYRHHLVREYLGAARGANSWKAAKKLSCMSQFYEIGSSLILLLFMTFVFAYNNWRQEIETVARGTSGDGGFIRPWQDVFKGWIGMVGGNNICLVKLIIGPFFRYESIWDFMHSLQFKTCTTSIGGMTNHYCRSCDAF